MVKLLVVDYQVDICDFVKSFFKDRGFEVFVAHDGKEALSVIESTGSDIVLLDMKMPVMDGMTTLKAMRTMDLDTKVIMVTAIEDTDLAEEAKHHGVVEYITKPLLLEQLERTVMTVAEQIKMAG